jgi:hypothetical protein
VTASNAPDAQAAYKSQMSIWGALTEQVRVAEPGRGMAGRILRKDDHRRRDVADDGGMDGRLLSTALLWGSRRSRRAALGAVLSARHTHWPGMRPPSTARFCPTGRISKPGRIALSGCGSPGQRDLEKASGRVSGARAGSGNLRGTRGLCGDAQGKKLKRRQPDWGNSPH